MLLSLLFVLVASGATALIYTACACLSPWWIVPLWLGAYVAVVLLYVLWLFTAILLSPAKENPSPRAMDFYHRCAVHTLRWLLQLLGIRATLKGAESIPADQPFLLVGNHRSAFDPIATVALLKQNRLCIVGKPEIFRVPVLGAALRRIGFFPIDRENPRNAVTAIKHGARVITEQGRSVGIYPEGTRSKTGALLPFHAGSFKIAKVANCPVVVTAVRIKEGWLFPRKVQLHVVDVMDTDFVKENNTAALAERAVEAIRKNLGI